MDQFKDLVSSRNVKPAPAKGKKANPIEQKKADEKKIHAALKQQEHAEKARKMEETEQLKRAYKDERLFAGSNSRRAREDARKEDKKAVRESEGGPQVCEHGIAKCRVCNPLTDKIDHRMKARVVQVDDA